MEKKDISEKKYKCDKCGYTATRSDNLKQHVFAVHDKMKNFKCKQCEYATSLVENLKRHVMRAHDKLDHL